MFPQAAPWRQRNTGEQIKDRPDPQTARNERKDPSNSIRIFLRGGNRSDLKGVLQGDHSGFFRNVGGSTVDTPLSLKFFSSDRG
jgi:hypothetical protein